jgi:hypothetical protein
MDKTIGVIGKRIEIDKLEKPNITGYLLVEKDGVLEFSKPDLDDFILDYENLGNAQLSDIPSLNDHIDYISLGNDLDFFVGLVDDSYEAEGLIKALEWLYKKQVGAILITYNIKSTDEEFLRRMYNVTQKIFFEGVNIYCPFYDSEKVFPAVFNTVFSVGFREFLSSLINNKISIDGVDFVINEKEKNILDSSVSNLSANPLSGFSYTIDNRKKGVVDDNIFAASVYLSKFSLKKYRNSLKKSVQLKVLPLSSEEVFCLIDINKIPENLRQSVCGEGEFVVMSFEVVSLSLIKQISGANSLVDIEKLGLPFNASVNPIICLNNNIYNWIKVSHTNLSKRFNVVFLVAGVGRRIVSRSDFFEIKKSYEGVLL